MAEVKATKPSGGDRASRDNSVRTQVIRSQSGWRGLPLRELWEYRDLVYFLIWRDIKARYAQSVLGIGWAVVQPVFYMIIFTVVFGKLAKIDSDGVPYAIFSYTALVPWTYFANALSDTTSSILSSRGMITKVYIPRLVVPISATLSKLMDFIIAFLLLVALMAWFRIAPTIMVLTLPVLIFYMVLAAGGLGMWLTPMAMQYRDIKYGIGFLVQLFMYASPVVYPVSLIPDEYRLLYAINPMVGVIEGFRSALLSTHPMPWDLLAVGGIVALAMVATGALYFRRMERVFADVA